MRVPAILLLTTLGTAQTAVHTQEVASPLLREILSNPTTERRRAIDHLLDSLQRSGTPLLEPVSETESIVTFFWRGGPQTSSVVVVTPSTLYDFDGSVMNRIDGTNIWYQSLLTHRAARFGYRFEIDGPLTSFDEDPQFFRRLTSWIRDPMNQRTFVYQTGDTVSVIELDRAPDARWSRPRPDAERGMIKDTVIASATLGGDRPVWVYLPPGYRGDGPAYPVLILTDGDSYRNQLAVNHTLDNLIAGHRIPPLIAVGITSPTRTADLACNPAFGDFVAQEILPWVVSTEHATQEAERVAIGGYSLGGLAAACAALRHPERIGMVLAQSGSFRRPEPSPAEPEGVARLIAESEPHVIRFYVEVGTEEIGPMHGGDPSTLTAVRHLRDVLEAKEYDLIYAEHNSGHEPVAWRETLHLGLIALFGR